MTKVIQLTVNNEIHLRSLGKVAKRKFTILIMTIGIMTNPLELRVDNLRTHQVGLVQLTLQTHSILLIQIT